MLSNIAAACEAGSHLQHPALEDSTRPGRARRGGDALEQGRQLAQAVVAQHAHAEALRHQHHAAQVLYLHRTDAL